MPGALTRSSALQTIQPVDWLFLPRGCRKALGWLTLTIFCSLFYLVPALAILLPCLFRCCRGGFWALLSVCLLSLLLPTREWKAARKLGQLWYEIFDFRHNLSKEDTRNILEWNASDNNRVILGMHPHGIVPLQAILWAAYCDQVLHDAYGVGAAANVLGYLPFLRNVMGWLAAGPADFKTLQKALLADNNLFILPGGVAEIFTSTPGCDIVVMGNRRGLVKLAIETKATLVPLYVFGGTGFFYNLVTGDNAISRFSRKLRLGLTLFWGRFGLPIPFAPRVSLVFGQPVSTAGASSSSQEDLDRIHRAYLESLHDVFEQFKVPAGYPNARLVIQ